MPAARRAVDAVLGRLQGDLADQPAHETIDTRWTCHAMLAAPGDARADAGLDQLHADVQARAAELTPAADRERLIQALPVFPDTVAAHRRRAG